VLLILRQLGQSDDQVRTLAIRLFGLTQAEAEVAAALVTGLGPKEIAIAREVQVSTIRTLLLRAQNKIGVGSLRDLVGTLAALRG
jgi:DNA-binding CsgD family transcriptional regulator